MFHVLRFLSIARALWRKVDLRRRLEGYTLSIVFHVLLLLLLATITINSSGGRFGLGLRAPGARVELSERNETEEADLERLFEDVELEPLRVERRVEPRAVLPQLDSLSVPRASRRPIEQLTTRFSPASGRIGALSGRFGSFIAGLRKTGLDVALVIDATGSMQHVIDEIKARSVALVERIQALVPIARVGVVAFRDRGEEFVVRWSDLSFHASKIEAFINQLQAEGGGDWEEAVREGLEAAIDELSWRRRAKRVIIIVGSSPPHAEDRPAIAALADEFRAAGGVVSTIDVTKRMHEEYERKLSKWLYGKAPEKISPLPAFYREVQDSYREIAEHGGGEMAALGSSDELTEQILTFAFGSRWRKEVARYTSEQ
ncbi:MAG: VWA domain-containing protein [Deltaproteobacteria bacterium]|nr:MAG: VWA domain-containing protein [Deltaproteobacteria bacterium]